LKEKIVEHMKKNGEWGEFFPIGTSGFGYNETVAQEYFPLSKEECADNNLPWWDESVGTFGNETLNSIDIPDDIKNIEDNILKEVLVCDCGKNYKIVPYELSFYRKISVPLPRKCPNCRHER